MRMFGYYALHSLFNQIRKICKTWVAVFILVCFGMGVGMGFLAGTIFPEDYEETEIAETEDTAEEEDSDVLIVIGDQTPITKEDAVEWAAGGVILLVLGYEILSADKQASAIFLPADTHLLFSSPLLPQDVLLFRLTITAGMALLSSAYLLIQVPNLVETFGLSVYAAVSLLVIWFLTLLTGKLLSVFVFLLSSQHRLLKKYLNEIVIACAAGIAGLYSLYKLHAQTDYITAARFFFNSPVSRYIPVWGWLKGIFLYAKEDNTAGSMLCFAGMLVFLLILFFVIRHMKADFYEEALQKSEERAALLEEAKHKGIVFQSSSHHDDQLLRDGMKHGWGASVFFFRPLYNRRRFAKFGVFTKTNVTYFSIVLCGILLSRFLIDLDPFVPCFSILAFLVFYRSLGNPLKEDINIPYFRLVPESPWKKLLYSLLSGIANTALDLIPALLLLEIAAPQPVLIFLGIFLLLLSVDFYATAVGVFMDLSVPQKAADSLKQAIQVMFLYFGLVPDLAIILVGWMYDYVYIGFAAAFACNCFFGALFTGVCPLFLEPESIKPERVKVFTGDPAKIRKIFSRIGWTLCAVTVSVNAAGLLLSRLLKPYAEQLGSLFSWLAGVAPFYLCSVLILLLLLRKEKNPSPEKHTMRIRDWLIFLVIAEAGMVIGNAAGNIVTMIFHLIVPSSESSSAISTLVMGSDLLWTVLFAVILSPVFEELFFRKALVDHLRSYGERQAMLFSGLMFGLFHGNFQQFFYAALLGMILAYIYLRTGKLRYCIAMHMAVNFLGSVVPMLLMQISSSQLETDLNTGVTAADIAVIVWLIAELICAMCGVVLFFIRKREMFYEPVEEEMPQKTERKLLYCNTGVISFILLSTAVFAVSLL